ncbi:MAG: glycosyltransferase family 39 protein [Chloroflexi bacterium]|nr:glycosyltransferase family 39 protein [Chloroflexota bacterium]MBP8057919.1 glycosyltransferase family 39 protein [Chloroflexota bacterium]
MKRYTPMGLILLLYLGVGALYATLTPHWQAPDEPAHYNFVRQLAGGRLPVIESTDYDQAFQGEAISAQFAPVYDVPDRYFSYEDWQPPLYYALLVPVYWLFGGALVPLRLASLVPGAGVVILTYAVARLVLRREMWALVAAAFVAFLPQHLAIMASVNNDALAELIIAAIVYILVRGLSEREQSAMNSEPLTPHPHHSPFSLYPILVGFLLGLGFLTKGSVYIMAPVIGLAVLRRYWGQWALVGQQGVVIAAAAALLAFPWWLRNSIVYGHLDIIAWQAHGDVVVGQPRTAEWFHQYGIFDTLQRFLTTTFHSFWGQFGWMGVVMPTWVYRVLLLLTVIAGVGVIAAAGKPRRPLPPSTFILLLTLTFALLLYLGYNITFVQHQGRYLFPALIPLACGLAVGLGTLWDRASHLLNRSLTIRTLWPALLPLGFILGLVGLDLLALFRFILPALST